MPLDGVKNIVLVSLQQEQCAHHPELSEPYTSATADFAPHQQLIDNDERKRWDLESSG